ncbi:hypothetical protein [Streptomyces canus]|uniref:hypothetical protein n=1 Tax=Streptomyces canus TaxID=58343 RepID=UPI0038506C3E
MGVSDIIVCGRSHCDVVTEVMHDSLRHRGVRRRSGPADRRRHRRRALARAQAIRRAHSPASGASTSPSASAATHAEMGQAAWLRRSRGVSSLIM